VESKHADGERGFSVMKLVKSNWRSRLSGHAVTDLMRVSLQSADVPDFDPTPAIYGTQLEPDPDDPSPDHMAFENAAPCVVEEDVMDLEMAGDSMVTDCNNE
jgi:hypothetical protein